MVVCVEGERGLKDREWGWVELGFTEGARYGRARCPLARDQLRDLEKCCISIPSGVCLHVFIAFN